MHNMPDTIEGFSQVEYLLIFNAIVFGAIANEFFAGWGAMLRYRNIVKFNPIQFAWSVFAFLLLIQNWFGMWPRSKYINDNAMFFYFSIIPMLLFYLMSIILFPNTKNVTFDNIDFYEHYNKNSRTLFTLFGIYLIFTILGSFVYNDLGNVMGQNALRLGALALCTLAIVFKTKKWIHITFLTFHFIGLAIFLIQLPK